MAQRMQKITPYQSGGNSIDHEKSTPQVEVTFKMAFDKKPDLLAKSLQVPHKEFSDNKMPMQRSASGGYKPKWAPMTADSRNASKATSMEKSTSKKGDNALGKSMNKVGEKVGYPKFKPKSGGRRNA